MKLPDSYYRYAAEGLGEEKKRIKDRISVRLPKDIAIKIERTALEGETMATDILRNILIDSGVLEEGDVELSGHKKNISRYLDKMDLGYYPPKRKMYHVPISRYAKIKIYRYLIDKNITVSQFFVKILANKIKGLDI